MRQGDKRPSMSKPSPKPRRRPPAAARPVDDESAPPEFEPVRTRVRWDGWTAERQSDFIQALAESGCVAEACRAVGMSERAAYALRARADAVSFRNAWDSALDFAIRRLSDAVLSRAINGVPRAARTGRSTRPSWSPPATTPNASCPMQARCGASWKREATA